MLYPNRALGYETTMTNDPAMRPPLEPRRILVAGASGRTGRLLVAEALKRGHDITVLVRDPSHVRVEHERLRVAIGDVRSSEDVGPAMEGRDAVISLLSHPSARVVDIFSVGTHVLADAAEAAGVRRFVVTSASPVGVDPARLPLAVRAVMLIPHLDVVYADMERMELDLMARERLDWTIVRPAVLSDADGDRRFRIVVGDLVPGGITTSRADLADFLLGLVETGAHIRERVAIAD